MPRKCSVPGCKTNYLSNMSYQKSVAPIYKFPQNSDICQLWYSKIGLPKHFTATKNNGVCAMHFQNADFTSESKHYYKNRKHPRIRQLKLKKLRESALPSLLLDYTHKYKEIQRNNSCVINSDERESPMLTEISVMPEPSTDIIESSMFTETSVGPETTTDIINDLDIVSLLPQINSNEVFWHVIKFLNSVNICKISVVKNFSIIASICLQSQGNALSPLVYIENVKINSGKYSHLLTKGLVFCASQISALINFVELENCNINNSDKQLSSIITSFIDKATSHINDEQLSDNKRTQLHFFFEQLTLMTQNKYGRRYHSNTLLLAYQIYSLSQQIYEKIRNANCFILPSKRLLRKTISSLNVDVGTNECNSSYIKYLCSKFTEYERDVSLIIDEVSLLGGFDYIGGNINGSDIESGKKSSTILAFMISPLKSKMNEIIALIPSCGVTTMLLHKYVIQVLENLSKLNINVIAIVVDNHRINQGLLKKLSNVDKLEDCGVPIRNIYNNNCCPIHLLVDTVHLTKSIRNNWMTKKILTFRDPGSSSILTCNFQDIINVYNKESGSVTKIAKGLTRKSVYPNNIEKQQFKPVYGIFSDNCLCALNIYKDELQINPGTIFFVNLISKFWKIVDTKNPDTGVRLRDSFRYPISSVSSMQMNFLNFFLTFLLEWSVCCKNDGFSALSDMTMSALCLTVRSLISLCHYFLVNRCDRFILLGKFQSDGLESRFGVYRQIGGARYMLSVASVTEAEKKIRIQHLLGQSHKFGPIKIQLQEISKLDNSNMNHMHHPFKLSCDAICKRYSNALIESHLTELTTSEISTIVFISGYVQRKLNRICQSCRAAGVIRSCNNTLWDSLSNNFSNINRGGLTEPSSRLCDFSAICLIIFKAIIKDAIVESLFLREKNQRRVLQYLFNETKTKSVHDDHTNDKKCKFLSAVTLCNIFLNNYCKALNERQHTKTKKCDKRKLQKFAST